MKKFQFKFETVLKVKERKEEQLKRELMYIQKLKIEQEQILEKIGAERKKMHEQKGREKQGGTDISTLIYYEAYLNSLRAQIARTEKRIKEFTEKADEKRVEVVEASREKKIFENLKDRHFSVFKKAVLSNEQKQLDEMAVNKYNRKEQHNY